MNLPLECCFYIYNYYINAVLELIYFIYRVSLKLISQIMYVHVNLVATVPLFRFRRACTLKLQVVGKLLHTSTIQPHQLGLRQSYTVFKSTLNGRQTKFISAYTLLRLFGDCSDCDVASKFYISCRQCKYNLILDTSEREEDTFWAN